MSPSVVFFKLQRFSTLEKTKFGEKIFLQTFSKLGENDIFFKKSVEKGKRKKRTRLKKRVGYSMFSTFGEGLEKAWRRLREGLEKA